MSKKSSVEIDANKDGVNVGLAVGSIVAAAVPIIAVAATGGIAAVPVALWVGLASIIPGLFAGNIRRHRS
jgi:hypothetical protein